MPNQSRLRTPWVTRRDKGQGGDVKLFNKRLLPGGGSTPEVKSYFFGVTGPTEASGVASGVAAVSALGRKLQEASATLSGVAVSSAAGATVKATSGVVSGDAASLATGARIANGVANSVAVAVVSANGVRIASTIATSDGTTTVLGDGAVVTPSTGVSDSIATTSGAGNATRIAVGLAAGHSQATAVSFSDLLEDTPAKRTLKVPHHNRSTMMNPHSRVAITKQQLRSVNA